MLTSSPLHLREQQGWDFAVPLTAVDGPGLLLMSYFCPLQHSRAALEGGYENPIAFVFCLDRWEKCGASKDKNGSSRKNLQGLGKSLAVKLEAHINL